jgi:hypothetical protein
VHVHDSMPSALLERSRRLANVELHAVALQHRRLRSTEPEDDAFVLRWWADLQFLIIALRRLRRAVRIVAGEDGIDTALPTALARFDAALPSLQTMRNISEHIDAYALDSPHRHNRTIDRRQLEAGSWDGSTFRWRTKPDGTAHELNIDKALDAARELYDALQEAEAPARNTDVHDGIRPA